MKKLTLKTVIDALDHCSDKQEAELLDYVNRVDAWSGIILGEIIRDYLESMKEDNGCMTQQQSDEEAGFKRGE
jgi:hypothetical protein